MPANYLLKDKLDCCIPFNNSKHFNST